MKFILLFFIILSSVFSYQVEAQDPFLFGDRVDLETPATGQVGNTAFIPQMARYPEPSTVTIAAPTHYYKKAYGYNTKDACIGKMCLPTGAQVGCEYSYNNGGTPGSQVQICSIKTIQRPDGAVEDVSKNKLMFVTGLINDKKEFNAPPENEILHMKYSFGKWKLKKFEPAPAVDNSTLNAGVCPFGNCDEQVDPCKTKSVFSDISCFGRILKTLPDVVFGESEYADPTFNHKKIADAFVIGGGNTDFRAACVSFIDKTGHLGAKGKKVLEAIEKVGGDCFNGESGNIDISGICPKFNTFSKKQKEYFWVWTFAALASDESDCGTKNNPRAKNGVAYGLFQMESLKWRKKNGRDRRYCPYHEVPSNDVNFQMQCTTSIMVDTVCKSGKALNYPSGYWAQLRKNGTVTQHVREYPGCN